MRRKKKSETYRGRVCARRGPLCSLFQGLVTLSGEPDLSSGIVDDLVRGMLSGHVAPMARVLDALVQNLGKKLGRRLRAEFVDLRLDVLEPALLCCRGKREKGQAMAAISHGIQRGLQNEHHQIQPMRGESLADKNRFLMRYQHSPHCSLRRLDG
jgi:hypothetical protein